MLAGDAPKAFSAQLVALTLIALKLGKERETLSPEELSANLGATARRSGLGADIAGSGGGIHAS